MSCGCGNCGTILIQSGEPGSPGELQPETSWVKLCDVQPDGTSVSFIRVYQRDQDGGITGFTDYDLEGQAYLSTGLVGFCDTTSVPVDESPPEQLCPVASAQVLRLCDLNPDVPPDVEGRICATPFLRHVIVTCDGQITTIDSDLNGQRYEPIRVVDCTHETPSLEPLPWPQTNIAGNNQGGTEFDFTLTNPQTEETANVHFTTVTPAGPPACGASPAGEPPQVNAQFAGTTTPSRGAVPQNTRFTYELDQAARQAHRFVLQFLDLDAFEGVYFLDPPPDDVRFFDAATEAEITNQGYWPYNGNPADIQYPYTPGDPDNLNDTTVYAYYNDPATIPDGQITHLYGNWGSGGACHGPSFAMVTLVPGPCCGCAADGGGSPGDCDCDVCLVENGGLSTDANGCLQVCVSQAVNNVLSIDPFGCLHVPEPVPPVPVHGFEVLPANLDLQPTPNEQWTDTTLEVTLPEAGTYHLDATVRASLTGPSPINTAIVARLLDVTANAAVPGSEILAVQHLRSAATGGGPNDGDNDTAPIQVEYTVAGPTVVRLQAQRGNILGATTTAGVLSAESGRTTLRFWKVI